MTLEIIITDEQDARDVIRALSVYARSVAGAERPIPPTAQAELARLDALRHRVEAQLDEAQ